MEIGLVQKIDIDREMQQAYLDYAMSVIVARALPDARDGLKPVHRRILYAMYDMGLRPDTAYKKSARIVGEVLGKYHPHGDMAVYESMARMAQDFSMRYLLVDGQGNFGSLDGDPPAAMRYTEARLSSAAMQILADIQKETVDFDDNFDGSLSEPSVLPSAIPNLLVNGATGIAVGMATSIPPHNLSEVIDASRFMLDHWEKLDDVGVEDLMHFIQGPDFPTGGIILHDQFGEGLHAIYGTGRGRVTVRANAHLEEMDRGRSRIIVTELPYQTNKSSLIERIAELAREDRLQGIVDLRDESDRHGMRIVIELSKTVEPESVLRELYRLTPMQSTQSIILLALVDGEPRMLSLKAALRVYLEHRLEIIRRRNEYDLRRALARAHVLEGLRIAIKNLDEIIALIRAAPDVETARQRLIKKFKLSEIQAQAILEMPLRRLAALERKKIEEEYKELLTQIKDIESLLKSPKRMRALVSDELLKMKETYGDRRRTHIISLADGQAPISLLTAADLTPDKKVWVSVSQAGLVSRSLDETLPVWANGPDEPPDPPRLLIRAGTRDILYLATESGEAAAAAVHSLPEVSTLSSGAPIHKICGLREGQPVIAILAVPLQEKRTEETTPAESICLLTVSRLGMIKKTALEDLPGPTAGTFTLARVNEGDRLMGMEVINPKDEILLFTNRGMSIRFSGVDVRPMGLVAAGVMGIKLQTGDEVSAVILPNRPGEICLAASDGGLKRLRLSEFPLQGRYGQGLVAWKLPKNAHLIGAVLAPPPDSVLLRAEDGFVSTLPLAKIPLTDRAGRGKVMVELSKGAGLAGCLTVPITREPAPVATGSGPGPKGGPARSKPAKAAPVAVKSPAKTAPSRPKEATPAAAKASKPGTPAVPAKPGAKTSSKTTARAGAQPQVKSPAKVEVKSAGKPAAKARAAEKPPEKTGPAAKPSAKAAASKPAKPASKPAARTVPAPAPAKSRRSTPSAQSKPDLEPPAKPASGKPGPAGAAQQLSLLEPPPDSTAPVKRPRKKAGKPEA
jgi:DNA gyrase subunit A